MGPFPAAPPSPVGNSMGRAEVLQPSLGGKELLQLSPRAAAAVRAKERGCS